MTRIIASLSTLAVATSLIAATPALARNGADDPAGDNHGAAGGNATQVLRSGTCTGPSTAKLKAKPRNNKLEVEFEVDRNRAGVRYDVVLRRNGVVFSHTSRVTAGRSGSFSVERRTPNGVGTDHITATATRSDETCSAALSI
jgi:hypothetical protein